MPLDLTLHMGTAHLPVSEVMALCDGDVLELDAAVDGPHPRDTVHISGSATPKSGISLC